VWEEQIVWEEVATYSFDGVDEMRDTGQTKMVRIVPPEAIVPLCVDCHKTYDAHKLNLLPYLDPDKSQPQLEQANAVKALGIDRATRRLTGKRVDVA
jgi:hypothetical protein